ncbi:hypothetical protein ACWD25_04040 [Streptomyces sp. NPDC002920]
MRHPIVAFILARLDEEDADFPNLDDWRARVAELECHLVAGGELFGNEDLDPAVTKRELALAGLKVAALRYREHPDYDDGWLPPFASDQPTA